MAYKNLERRKERAKEYRHDNPTVHRSSDAKYKRTDKGRLAHLKARAKERNIVVCLTEMEYKQIRSIGVCAYCGSDLPDIGHGLDRIDNNLGYTKENVVPCCGKCNRIRGDDLTHEEMVVAMKAVCEYRNNGPVA